MALRGIRVGAINKEKLRGVTVELTGQITVELDPDVEKVVEYKLDAVDDPAILALEGQELQDAILKRLGSHVDRLVAEDGGVPEKETAVVDRTGLKNSLTPAEYAALR